MTGQAWPTLHYMVRCGGSNRPLWWCGDLLQGQTRLDQATTNHYYRLLTTDYWPVTVWEEVVLSILAVWEAGRPWGPPGPGGQYTRLLLFVTQRPLSPSAFRSIRSFPSEIRNILSLSNIFISGGWWEKDFYVSSQTDGRVIVLLTVKSHFSHFYRGWCRDFVISKKLSASVKWDLGAVRCNALNHEK